ncbi:hypothetical protein BJ170DRAFT_448176 [Xylariales sp. AK1849]|nr:hypothetical protein BJ170DRAFT_448176 [Xylariales sp. AK1849]
MCIYKRIIFADCNHSQWSPQPLRECEAQKSFHAGQSPNPCKAPRGHPLASVKVEGKCVVCRGRHEKVDERLQRAKDLINESKKTLIGTDERCRAILEDAGIDVSDVDDEEGTAKATEHGYRASKEEFERIERMGSRSKEGRSKKGDGTGLDKGIEEAQDPAVEFLKKRRESKNAALFMA